MQVIKEAWYIAVASSKLHKRPIRRIVEGNAIVLFRDSQGIPSALLDKCLHRGMMLSEGRVLKGSIQCPYHGWKYDGKGNVVEVPALCNTKQSSCNYKLKAYPTIEQDDHIWVWLGDSQATGEPYRFPHVSEKGWNTFFMHTRFHAPVEACLENFLDVPHTIFVHPGLFRGKKQVFTKVKVTREIGSVVADFVDEPELRGFGPSFCLPKGTKMQHTDRFILPSISRVDYKFGDSRRFIITSQCTQLTEYEVVVTTAITWQLPLPSFIGHAFLRPYCRWVINQDVRLLNKLGKQIEKFGVTSLHTSADLLGKQINILRSAAEKGETLQEQKFKETVLSI